MKGKQIAVLIGFLILMCVLTAGYVVYTSNQAGTTSQSEEVKMFAERTDNKLFQEVPVFNVADGRIGDVAKTGGGNYAVSVNGSTVDEYWSYVEVLQDNGFDKYVDNGQEGLNGNVYSATFTKEKLVLTVMHMVKTNLTYIVAEENVALSERLIYKKEYADNLIPGAQTTLHMVELHQSGNSFVLQLKNGHFILCDGGYTEDLAFLLEYLESLAPEGEKPVIEAWMITHLHVDHAALFQEFQTTPSYADRIYVEGIYMDKVDSEIATANSVTGIMLGVQTASTVLKTTSGEAPKIYRPQAGQTYYFADIKVEVLQTLVQTPESEWYRFTTNLNEFSTWYMFHIEDQKYLNAGDADFGSMKAIMRTYDSEYFNMDIMAVQHHGINVHNEFTDFIEVKTLLYPYFGEQGVFKEGITGWAGAWQASVYRNEYLQAKVVETMSYGDGTKVLTFPYQVGEAKSLGQQLEHTISDDGHRIEY